MSAPLPHIVAYHRSPNQRQAVAWFLSLKSIFGNGVELHPGPSLPLGFYDHSGAGRCFHFDPESGQLDFTAGNRLEKMVPLEISIACARSPMRQNVYTTCRLTIRESSSRCAMTLMVGADESLLRRPRMRPTAFSASSTQDSSQVSSSLEGRSRAPHSLARKVRGQAGVAATAKSANRDSRASLRGRP